MYRFATSSNVQVQRPDDRRIEVIAQSLPLWGGVLVFAFGACPDGTAASRQAPCVWPGQCSAPPARSRLQTPLSGTRWRLTSVVRSYPVSWMAACSLAPSSAKLQHLDSACSPPKEPGRGLTWG